MSRIGRKPVPIPDGVTVEVKSGLVEVSGPKGKLSTNIPPGITVKRESAELVFTRASDDKQQRSFHGLARSLVANMVEGALKGFSKVLMISGTGYRVEEDGKGQLKFTLGYSHPINFNLPEGVHATIEERGTKLIIEGVDKQLVGEVAARIRRLRPPDAYKGKGIRYSDEVLRLKAGKAGIKK